MRSLMQRWLNFWRPLRTWTKVLIGGAALISFLFIFFVISYETVHYTETTEFCSTCHDVMEPEIATHEISAHANVDCGACHVGEGIEWKLYYKVSALRYLYTLPLQLYDRPLGSAHDAMRTSDAVCEQCHSPANAQGIKLFADYDYAPDEENSLTRTNMVLKIGDGTNPIGSGDGLGAHWHVTHPVTYIAEDEFRQDIPWVQVEKDGEIIEYVDTEADLSALDIENAEKHQIDCMDCHSRSGHIIQKPDDMLDNAMIEGLVPSDLPFIKAQGSELLNERYATEEEALETIATSIRGYYETEWPDVYADRQSDVEQSIEQMSVIYEDTSFPHMNAYWDSYPNNEGHKDFPGCWRCHDGNHLNAANEVIPVSCDTCHAIPEVVEPDQPLPVIDLSAQEMPESHESSLWIAEHRFRFDATCDDCHTVNFPGGNDNSSFCSNSGCHVGGWTYLDIDAPEILALVAPERQSTERALPQIPHPINANTDCVICHGPDKLLAYPENHAEYANDECTDCHQLAESVSSDLPAAEEGSTQSAAPADVADAPEISHAMAGNENCLACHAIDGAIAPAPFTHSSFTNDTCQMCHLLSPEFIGTIVTPAPVEESPPSEATATTEPTTAESTATESTAADDKTATSTPTPEGAETDAADDAAEADDVVDDVATDAPAVTSHPVAGNENCLACHAVDGNIAPAPRTHAAFTNDTCQQCHIADSDGAADAQDAEVAPEAEQASPPATADAAEEPADEAPAEASAAQTIAQPPAIPHPLPAWADCLSCHGIEEGVASLPADHSTFSNAMCEMCHDLESAVGERP